MKKVILVSAHFLPCNLAGVQRVRLMSSALKDFGWEPIVVTVDHRQYEETLDSASLQLIPNGIRVERVWAWPASLCRWIGLGDISVRGHFSLRRRVASLLERFRPAVLFVTVLPGYTSLIGGWAKRRLQLPFVLDYQDPWVSDWGKHQPLFSKARISNLLAAKLEPYAVSRADAISAVSNETLLSLRDRGLIRSGLPVEIIPIGCDANDHAVAERSGESQISKRSDEYVIAYLGTITDRMMPAARTVFRALSAVGKKLVNKRLKLHFIGTSGLPNGGDVHGLVRIASECGIGDCFRLEPRRVGYLDALRTMQDADILLLIGSTDSHYTASKVFPCWLTGKPVVALFHALSTVNQLASDLGGIQVITYDEICTVETRVDEVSRVFKRLVFEGSAHISQRIGSAFEQYSARGVARRFADLFDRIAVDTGRDS